MAVGGRDLLGEISAIKSLHFGPKGQLHASPGQRPVYYRQPCNLVPTLCAGEKMGEGVISEPVSCGSHEIDCRAWLTHGGDAGRGRRDSHLGARKRGGMSF